MSSFKGTPGPGIVATRFRFYEGAAWHYLDGQKDMSSYAPGCQQEFLAAVPLPRKGETTRIGEDCFVVVYKDREYTYSEGCVFVKYESRDPRTRTVRNCSREITGQKMAEMIAQIVHEFIQHESRDRHYSELLALAERLVALPMLHVTDNTAPLVRDARTLVARIKGE